MLLFLVNAEKSDVSTSPSLRFDGGGDFLGSYMCYDIEIIWFFGMFIYISITKFIYRNSCIY